MSEITTSVVTTMTQAGYASVWTDVVVAALVAGVMSFVLMIADHRREQRNRLRDQFAEAFRAYAAYREFPYAIRRRASDEPVERSRLADELRHVQEQLTFWMAWMEMESPSVSREYSRLVFDMRDVAGNAMRRAWEFVPTEKGRDMNIPDYADELAMLRDAEKDFIHAARRRLRPWAIGRP